MTITLTDGTEITLDRRYIESKCHWTAEMNQAARYLGRVF